MAICGVHLRTAPYNYSRTFGSLELRASRIRRRYYF